MTQAVRYDEMRREVLSALESLGDVDHQQTRWGHYDASENYLDDLTLNVHILYDDCMVLPDPAPAVGEIIYASEVQSLERLSGALTPLIDRIGDAPDATYLSDPAWPDVVSAAQAARHSMLAGERADGDG